MERTPILGAVVMVVFLILAGCAPAAAPAPPPPQPAKAPEALTPEDAAWAKVVSEAKKEGKVAIYISFLLGDAGKTVLGAFEEQMGIKAEILGATGPANLERVKTEHAAKKYIADVFDAGTSTNLMLKDAGLTVPVAQELPALRQKGVWSAQPQLDGEGHLLGIARAFMTVFINTTKVKPDDEPKALRDFLDPRWKGKKIGINDPSVSPYFIYTYYYRQRYGVDEDFFRQLAKQEPLYVPVHKDLVSKLAIGETAATVMSNQLHWASVIREGAPIKAIELAGGVVYHAIPVESLVKNAPRPNAARVFLNWLLTAEGQKVIIKALGATPFRNDVPDIVAAEVFRFKPQKAYQESLEDTRKVVDLYEQMVVPRLMGMGK